MKDDELVKLGAVLVAAAVAYSVVAEEAQPGNAMSSVPSDALVILLLVGVLGFIGRRAFTAWRKDAPPTRQPWVRRRPALPPPPEPDHRNDPP